MTALSRLAESEITLINRIYTLVLLLKAWVIWLFGSVVVILLLAAIEALLNSQSSSAFNNVGWFSVITKSKALIAYMRGDADPLKRFVLSEITEKERKIAEKERRKAGGKQPQATTRQKLNSVLVIGFIALVMVIVFGGTALLMK